MQSKSLTSVYNTSAVSPQCAVPVDLKKRAEVDLLTQLYMFSSKETMPQAPPLKVIDVNLENIEDEDFDCL